MSVIKKKKFSNPILNEFCVLFNSRIEQSQICFDDYFEYYQDITLDTDSLNIFNKDLDMFDQFMKINETKARALFESYEILFENAIALNSSELYFDVLYSIIHGLVNNLKSVAQISIKQHCNFNNMNISANFESSSMSSCFFAVL